MARSTRLSAEVAELDLLAEHGRELGVAPGRAAAVRRVQAVAGDTVLSGLRWGSEPPELVLLHGGGQDAHAWDGVLLRARRPALALDLPGHGRSAWPGRYRPRDHAPLVAAAVDQLAPGADAVVGMALGGLTGLCLAAWYPELVRRLVMVDVAGPARRHERHPDRLTRLYAELPGYAELARGVRCPTTLVLDGRSRVLAAAGVDRLRAAIPQLEVVTVDAGDRMSGGQPPDVLGAVERTGTPARGTR